MKSLLKFSLKIFERKGREANQDFALDGIEAGI